MLSGVALLLGGLLVAAGLPKAAAPDYVASALRRVVTAGPDPALRLAGRLLGCWEVALGLALVLVGPSGPAGVAVAALAVATFAGFTAFVVLAIRRGAACGCWASLSEGPAGGAELGRAVYLTALAVDHLLLRATHTGGWGWGGASLAWAFGLLAGVAVAAVLGGALLPVPTAGLRRQLRAQAAPGVLGRAAGQARLLLGFVHAGTRAGRRRYLAARVAAARPVRRASTPLPPRPLPPHPARAPLPPRPLPRRPAPEPVAPEGRSR